MTHRADGTGGQPGGPAGKAAFDAAPRPGQSPASLWADWVTIWQSELNAMAVDREAQQAAQHAWGQMVAFWAAQARAAGAFLPDGAHGPARPESAPRPASAAAAPGAGELEQQQRELERLAGRVAELERRLGGARSDDGDGAGA